MTKDSKEEQPVRFCMACGTPTTDSAVCQHCGKALNLPDDMGLVEDEGAAARRTFEEGADGGGGHERK
ncbi:hypothetical protein [[Kitasatospora] papulosa]|uniref:hypothetical protein n=1 Tax=[Kitasatospora] papulosa TaxID=1464011 RepID=UPI0038121A78